MRSDVHVAALRAAARVALSVASVTLVDGCASSGETIADETASNELTATRSEGTKEACDDAEPAKTSCEAVLASAFADSSDFDWLPHPQSSDVVACCDEELSEKGVRSPYRWQCCYAYDPAEGEPDWSPGSLFHQHAAACTPWGPPVPPSMDRAVRPKPEVAAWLAKAVA